MTVGLESCLVMDAEIWFRGTIFDVVDEKILKKVFFLKKFIWV